MCAWTCQFGNYDAKLKSVVEWKPMKRTKLTGRGNKGSTKGRSRHLLGPVRPLFGMSERSCLECSSIDRGSFLCPHRSSAKGDLNQRVAEVIGSSNALLDEGGSKIITYTQDAL